MTSTNPFNSQADETPTFSKIVTDYWLGQAARDTHSASVPEEPGRLRIVLDPDLPRSRRIMRLDLANVGGLLTLTPEMAKRMNLAAGSEIGQAELEQALHQANENMNGADLLFYYAECDQTTLREETPTVSVRQLTAEDAQAFAAFVAAAPEDEMDEAFVELDHWLVFGCFAADRLVAAASMYPWSGTTFADVGIITLPDFRGQGYARQTVRAICAHALELGYEPQYRCRIDHTASAALAGAAGFSRFATWDVVEED
ncbi:hypothetical protein B9G55_14590 [Saccharibacillus sp. O16]|nr:hypothetical protein B9G55_14590 [Saccharibacillus sp. O16]